MYCKHCGKEIDDNSSFCKYCGKSQGYRVSTSNGLIDFVTNNPLVSSYILWVIINVICLCRGHKIGRFYNILYPKFHLGTISIEAGGTTDYYNLNSYQITDFLVYTILIPLVIFLGYHYFKKVTSTKYRIGWGIWFLFHILMYNLSNLRIDDYFFPFTIAKRQSYWDSYDYPLFAYDAYDLSELVFYTMIIPIAYWGYLYYKDKKSAKSN